MTENHNKPSIYPWIVWSLGAAFFLLEYFARVGPSVMVPDLMRDFGVDALSLGSLSAFFYYAYVAMQVPVGTLVDCFGPRRLLTVMAALCGLSCILFASSHSLGMAELTRFIMGFSAAFAFVSTLKIATVWFPASRLGLLAGLTQGLGMLGAAIGEGPLSVSVVHIGWRETMILVGVVLFLLAALIAIVMRDSPPGQAVHKNRVADWRELLRGLGFVLSNPQSWLNALYAGFIYAPMAAFAELWGVAFIVATHGLDREVAASAVGCIFIGWAIGGPIMGWLSDYIGRRRPLMAISALTSLIVMSMVLYLPNLNTPLLFLLLFLFGIANTGVAVSYALAGEINSRPVAGTSMAFANMASVLIGAALQPVIGGLLVKYWHGITSHGIPIYSAATFRIAMLVIPLCLFLGFITSFFVRETYCRPVAPPP